MQADFKQRVGRVKRLLKAQSGAAALLLSSAPARTESRDGLYRYRQDSDFYYLTGTHAKDLLLIISSEEPRPLLFVPKQDPEKILWDGKPPSYPSIARRIGAKLVVCTTPAPEAKKHLRRLEHLYFQNVSGSKAWSVANELLALPSHRRVGWPDHFHHSDILLEPLRLIKSAAEVRAMREAAELTADALFSSLPLVRPGSSELEIAALIDYHYRLGGGHAAFATISASGPSAATLHYDSLTRKLKRGDMFLLDWGASLNMYAADITRVFPVGGKFSPLQRDLYQIVLESQQAAIKKIKHNVQIKTVYDAAAKRLTEGLVELGVLRGRPSTLFQKKAYRKYFPHGIGHGLGIDVHDIGKLRGNTTPRLLKGMVFTVEPGLYFPTKTRRVPACGVRIEDDVLVTEKGSKILTSMVPKEVAEVEELFL